MGRGKGLTPKEAKFVEEYLKTGYAAASAIAAGYSQKSSHQAAYRLLHENQGVMEKITEARNLVEAKGVFGLQTAMEHAEGARLRAIENKNGNAEVKSVELMAKLHGLLVEKHDVRQVGFSIKIEGIEDPGTIIQTTGKKSEDEDDDIFG